MTPPTSSTSAHATSPGTSLLPHADLATHCHAPLRGEQQTGRCDPDTVLEVTLLLRHGRPLPSLHDEFGARPPQQRGYLSHADYREAHGAGQADLDAVTRFAAEHTLELVSSSHSRRTVVLRGRVSQMEDAFGVSLAEMRHARGRYRAAHAAPSLPPELRSIVRGVLGLNTRPCSRRPLVHHGASGEPFWTLPQMAAAYGFSEAMRADGERIALIELGGGYHASDLKQFFSALGRPVPVVREVNVGGAGNSPASPEYIRALFDVVSGKRSAAEFSPDVLTAAQCTVEVTMDIELAAALAPGAEIAVYFAPGDEQGIHDALSRALHDPAGTPSAISISWGEPESGVSAAYLAAVEDVLREAALLGVTVCASSGDDGALHPEDKTPTVNFPASSPHVLACGGSSVMEEDRHALHEVVWNCMAHGMTGASGGGVSQVFPLPGWQREQRVPSSPRGTPGRGVPDVAGPADPHRGCALVVGGQSLSSAGTSAVAPLWAALIAVLNHELGARCGYLTPLLYGQDVQSAGAVRAITSGGNGYYAAGPGWNACTGLGSPLAHKLLEHLRSGS